MTPKLVKGAIVTAAAAAALYLGASLIAGWRGVVDAFAAVGALTFSAALALSLGNYLLRLARWRLYLSALGTQLDWETSEAIYLAGFALTATPGKAGELFRGVFLKAHGASFLTTTTAFLSERLSDLAGVVAIALPGAAALPRGAWIAGFGLALTVALGLALSQERWLRAARAALEAPRAIKFGKARALVDLLIEARRCHTPKLLMTATCLSLAAWTCEAYAFHMVLARMDVSIGLYVAMSIYALSMIAGAISFLPGGVGGAEAVMTTLLIASGAPDAKAVAATLIIRLATLWFAVAVGVLAIAIERRRLWPSAAAAPA